MKRTNEAQRAGWRLLAAGVLAVIVAVLILPVTALASGLFLAVGASFTSEIREDTTPDAHKVRDVSIELTWIRPDLNPLDTILRRMEAKRGRSMAEAVKIEWEEDEVLPRTDAVNGIHTAGTAGAIKVVTVANGSYWRVDDLIYLPKNATAPGAVLWVESITGNDLSVRRVGAAAFGTVPALADAETLRRMSNAKKDFNLASDPRATMPAQLFNYEQIFDSTDAISETRMATKNYTMPDRARNQRNILYDYRTSLEFAQIFGSRAQIADPNSPGNFRWFQGGITDFLSTNDFTYTAGAVTESTVIDWSKDTFSGNAGSRKRLFFTTPNLTAEIDKVLIASGTLQSFRDEKVLGVEATRIKSSFGQLFLINHQGMAEFGKTNYGLIIDPANVRRRPLRPMKKRPIRQPNEDGMRDQWIEQCSTEVRYEETHAVVRVAATDSFR